MPSFEYQRAVRGSAILSILIATTMNCGCTYKSRRDLWHMQADYNSFQAPSVQIEQKNRRPYSPSQVQQYLWMYNHWPDQVDSGKSIVHVATRRESVEPKQTTARGDRRIPKSEVAVIGQSRTEPEPEPAPPFVTGLGAFDVPSPERHVAVEQAQMNEDLAIEARDAVRRPIREIPNIDTEELELSPHRQRLSGIAQQDPRELSLGQRLQMRMSPSESVHQAWSFERGNDRPMVEVEPDPASIGFDHGSAQSRQLSGGRGIPTDLIQRSSADRSPSTSQFAGTAAKPRDPDWWGQSSAQTTSPPLPAPAQASRTDIPADEPEYDLPGEGIFEIR